MLKLLQTVRPNPLYTPGGVDNFWKVGRDDDVRKAANKAEEFGVPRNGKKDDLPIDSRRREEDKGLVDKERMEKGNVGTGGWAATCKDDKTTTGGWADAWSSETTATFQPVFKRIWKECNVELQ